MAIGTDYLDGYLARKHNIVTKFGKLADPIADKALTGMAFIGLSILGELWWWVTIVILVREWGITLMRFVMLRYGVMAAGRGGKTDPCAAGRSSSTGACYRGVSPCRGGEAARRVTGVTGWIRTRGGAARRKPRPPGRREGDPTVRDVIELLVRRANAGHGDLYRWSDRFAHRCPGPRRSTGEG